MNLSDLDTNHKPTWCPGCGNFGIWLSLKNALVKMDISPDQAFLVYGVGCHGNMNNWMKVYGLEGLHGRPLPVAQGVKAANHNLHVIAVSGDGDSLGEGGNHFIGAAKRNPDISVIIHDNGVYGLTTGQASPTAKKGMKTKSTPTGVTDEPINPLTLAITAGATFVARAFAGDAPHLTDIIMQAIKHPGFSVVDVLQPCVTFNKVNTYAYYRQRVYKMDAEGYKPDDKIKAYQKALEWGDRIPVGVFYEEEKATSESLEAALKSGPLINSRPENGDFTSILDEFV